MIPEETNETTDFDDLIGQEFDFYGVDGNCFKLDEVVYESVEDPDDGYRSMLECVEIRDVGDKIFFQTPIARVVLERVEGEYIPGTHQDLDGFKLVDLHDGHEWLCFGTDKYDYSYPCFVFDYTPKATAADD